MTAAELPVAEFAFSGPLRDQLVAAVVAGEKTTTTGVRQLGGADVRIRYGP